MNLYKLIAFAGRYGHQPAAGMWDAPMRDLIAFTRAVASLMSEEAEAMREATAGGGG